jgi:hypothetical protein
MKKNPQACGDWVDCSDDLSIKDGDSMIKNGDCSLTNVGD